jgi:hypothetical protein
MKLKDIKDNYGLQFKFMKDAMQILTIDVSYIVLNTHNSFCSIACLKNGTVANFSENDAIMEEHVTFKEDVEVYIDF